MAKRQNKSAYLYQISMREALITFDLKKVKKWMQKYNNPLYESFKSMPEEVQMGTMCKMICNRTDLLGSDVHRKAINWLKEHNMKGRLF